MLLPLMFLLNVIIHIGAKPSLRIVGGSPAVQGQFPFSVSLKDSRTDNLICGASIISENFLITAGQCVFGKEPTDIVAYIGSVYLDQNGYYSPIDEFILHPDFDHNNFLNDVSLIKLKEPVQFGKDIQPIELPINITIGPGDQVTAIGWGFTSFPDGETNQLHYLSGTIMDEEKCSVILDQNIRPSQLCFGGIGGQGMCYGDFGSPLVYEANNQSYIVGIGSWAQLCAFGYPDVNTNTSYYVTWIEEQSTL